MSEKFGSTALPLIPARSQKKTNVCLLLNGTSALFRLLVSRTVQIKQIKYEKIDLRLTSSTYLHNVDVDTFDKLNTYNMHTVKTGVKIIVIRVQNYT